MKRETYENMYREVYRSGIGPVLNVVSTAITVLIATLYAVATVLAVMNDMVVGLRFILLTAVPFLIVTILRRIINSPRPYELISLPELSYLRKKGKAGRSFPSRHVASAMIVGGAVIPLFPFLGVFTMLMGVALGACRVLCGRHFLRDVVAGGIIGLVSGLVAAAFAGF